MKNMKKGMAVLIITGMAFGLFACGRKEPVKIASKPMTEQYILTEMIAQLIEEETAYEAEYTRSAWLNVLKKEEMEKDDDKLYEALLTEYDAMGLTWTGLYGFSNTYGLAVRQDTAEQYGLSSYSDLAAASGELVFGGNPDYIELETGYPRLCGAYGMQFQDTVQMEIALKYEALKNEEVDVINAFTTDAQLAANNLVLLTDDNVFFETYDEDKDDAREFLMQKGLIGK